MRVIVICFSVFSFVLQAANADELSFTRDIQPILAQRCFACHGPDEETREADLRLDVRAAAVEYGAIVPGDPGESELVRRIFADDPDERMPPPSFQETLTDQQRETLRRWVADGAKYEQHWAFVPPQRPEIPAVRNNDWPKNAIDHFVLARLEKEGLQPSPPAELYTLIRRLYLDLIGLPPTPEQADRWARALTVDEPAGRVDEDAYQQLVDELLGSQHYGERWARQWLDLARYSDTNGYEKDRPRSIWPYRDWVINALNEDMPFDQFTVEQLAGDMLPGATVDQRIATGFHRNTMLNEEGGIDPLEYRFYAMVDRVATTGTVWLGLTTGCAQCHSHKYDPISHADYYNLMALLNNADEPDLQVPVPEVVARRERIEQQIAKLEDELPRHFRPADGDGSIEQRRQANLERTFAEWLAEARKTAVDWTTIRPREMHSNLPKLEALDDGSVISSGDITKRDVYTLKFDIPETSVPITAIRLEALPDDRLPAGGPGRAFYEGRKGDFFLSELTATMDGQRLAFSDASHSFGKISIGSGTAAAKNVIDGEGSTGWSTAGGEGQPHQLVLTLKSPLQEPGNLEIGMLFERHFAASLGRFRFAVTGDPGEIRAKQMPVDIERILASEDESQPAPASTSTTAEPPSPRPEDQGDERDALLRYFLSVTPQLADARKPIDALRKQLPSLPTTMVMEERPGDNPRPTFRHHRGEFLSPREAAAPNIPTVFCADNHESSLPKNRLEFARWLVSEQNPLAARVTVNRAWRAFFGSGIVRTSGDFGTQSDPPTHPDLLDWLASEFVETHGWSLKKLHRQIVSSATYRQSSVVSDELLKRDPENRLLARGGRFRVDGETVRDLMLTASGLLSTKLGGPSVYPPQPASVTALAYGNTAWKPSTGEDRFRRSLYTFSKRTAPFAAYATFDAPSGEVCHARRDRSNTPLQALTLLNDAMYLEMARALAEMALQPEDRSDEERLTVIFRRLLTRRPTPEELATIVQFYQQQHARLENGELNAADLNGGNENKVLAAFTLTARALSNLDEVITRH